MSKTRHSTDHESGGSDEIDISGLLADATSAKASGTGDVTTTASLQDLTGATLSLEAGTYIVTGIFDVEVNNALNDRTFEGHLDVGGSDENDIALVVAGSLVNDRWTMPQVWRIVLGSTTTVKLRALHSGGTTGDFDVKGANTTITAYRAGGGGAPVDAKYVVSASNATLTNEVVIPELSSSHPDVPPSSPNTEDDEFDAGSLDAKWTRTGTPGVQTFASSRLTATMPSAGEVLYYQSYAPGASTAFTITAKFTGCQFHESTDYFGIDARDSGGTTIANVDIRYDGTMRFHTDVPTAAQNITILQTGGWGQQFYLKLARDASDVWTYSASLDGINYFNFVSATRTSATTIARISFRFGQTAARTTKSGSIDWFRRT